MRKPLFLLFLTLLTACATGKKALEKGNYDEAVFDAIKRLQKSPTNETASGVLQQAFPLAISTHTANISRLESSQEPFRWEKVVDEYNAIHRMGDELQRCPAGINLLGSAKRFDSPLQSARNLAADERYLAGNNALNYAQGNRQAAKDAFGHFQLVNQYVSNYKDTDGKMNQAFDLASVKVVVEQVTVTSKLYQLSNEYFQDRINEFLKNNRKMNQFIVFYTPQEAKSSNLKPDQVIHLQFDDFVVGQTYINTNTETVTSKDSVNVGDAMVNGKKVPILNKVTAKLSLTKKTVASKGLLDMQVLDYRNGQVLYQEKIPGEFVWNNEWGTYNGDERALTDKQKQACQSRELLPPAPQQLFIEFSKPIYDQFTYKVRRFYEKY